MSFNFGKIFSIGGYTHNMNTLSHVGDRVLYSVCVCSRVLTSSSTQNGSDLPQRSADVSPVALYTQTARIPMSLRSQNVRLAEYICWACSRSTIPRSDVDTSEIISSDDVPLMVSNRYKMPLDGAVFPSPSIPWSLCLILSVFSRSSLLRSMIVLKKANNLRRGFYGIGEFGRKLPSSFLNELFNLQWMVIRPLVIINLLLLSTFYIVMALKWDPVK